MTKEKSSIVSIFITNNNSFNKGNHEGMKSEHEKAVDLLKSKNVAKSNNDKNKSNNYFTLFADQDKYVSGQMAASIYKAK